MSKKKKTTLKEVFMAEETTESLPKIDLKVGDTILTGRFKNKKVTVKEFGTDDKGQPTVNGRPMLNFRIEKLMPEKE